MKKLYRFSAIALLVLPLVFTSCSDYLDRDDDDNITEADVFARYEKVNGLVSDVYAAARKQTVRWCSLSTSATVPLRTNVKEPT